MFQPSTILSNVQETSRGPQLTLTYPAAGVWAMGRYPLLAGAVIGGLPIASQVCIQVAQTYGVLGGLAGFVAVVLVGLGLVLWALAFLGRAPAQITFVAGELCVTEASLFRLRQGQWQQREIGDIAIGDSSIGTGEDCPLKELKIKFSRGGEFGLLRGRNPLVQEETVRTLRLALNLPVLAECV